jgi:hypothetical protein
VTLAPGCGMGGDVASGFCAFQCALDNNSDATEAMFGCVIDNECMAGLCKLKSVDP